MLPATAPEPFDSPAHIFEVLWDGIRAIAFIEERGVRLQDRYGRDITDRYPEVAGLRSQVDGSGVALDGELVALDSQGRPDFSRLRSRLSVSDPREAKSLASSNPVTYHAFDVLYRDGRPMLEYPLLRRKEFLRQVLRPGGAIATPDFVARDGIAFFEAAREHGLEGILAKEKDSRYLPGRRSRGWLKITVYNKDEFVVGGFTYAGRWKAGKRTVRRVPLSALLLGLYDDIGRFHYVGEVAGSFEGDPNTSLLDDLVSRRCPFAEEPATSGLVFWCRPELAATVRFAEWTPQRRLRFPVFEAFRPDVPAETRRLEPGG